MPYIAHRILGDDIEIIDLEENRENHKYSEDEIRTMAKEGELYCPECNAKYIVVNKMGKLFFSAPYKEFKHKEGCNEATTQKEVVNRRTIMMLNEWYLQLCGLYNTDEDTSRNTPHMRAEYEQNRTQGRTRSLNLTNIHKLVNYIIENPTFINMRISDDVLVKDLFIWKKKECLKYIKGNIDRPVIILFHKATACRTSEYTNYRKMRLDLNGDDDFTVYIDLYNYDFFSEYMYSNIMGYFLVKPINVRQRNSNRCIVDVKSEDIFHGKDRNIKEKYLLLNNILSNS